MTLMKLNPNILLNDEMVIVNWVNSSKSELSPFIILTSCSLAITRAEEDTYAKYSKRQLLIPASGKGNIPEKAF